MDYNCKLIGISNLTVTPVGFVMPLCNSCKTKDCTNPIEIMKISVLGVIKEVRLYNRGLEPKIVVDCEGYIEK
jgi:hypothetical protein